MFMCLFLCFSLFSVVCSLIWVFQIVSFAVICGTVATMRPVFVGNFEYETRQSELERLFSKYGRVDRVDMKSGTTLSIDFDS